MYRHHLSFNQFILPIILLGLILVAPHGMGIRFSIGHLDIPRIAIILMCAVGAYLYVKEWIIARKIILPQGSALLVVFTMLLVMSAMLSTNVPLSFRLAVQLLTMWIIFPLAYIKYFDNDADGSILNISMVTILMVVAALVFIEIITQKYFFPPELRTSYFGIEGYEWFSTRILYRNGVLLPQGGFTWNHSIAGLVCVGSGLAIYCQDKFKNIGLVISYIIFMMVATTGVRAGVMGVLIAVLLYAIWFRKPMVIIHFVAAILLIDILYLAYFGIHVPFLLAQDIGRQWVDDTLVNLQAIDESVKVVGSATTDYFANFGTVGIKILGFLVNLMSIEEWFFAGYGFGSFQRPAEIVSTAHQYNDPGLIQLFYLESGVIAGGLFTFILIRATLLGLKYDEMKYYSVGITAWAFFALSSWDVWQLMFVVLFILKISHFHHLQQHKTT